MCGAKPDGTNGCRNEKTAQNGWRAFESGGIVGTKTDAKIAIGVEDIMAKMGAGTMMSQYQEANIEETRQEMVADEGR